MLPPMSKFAKFLESDWNFGNRLDLTWLYSTKIVNSEWTSEKRNRTRKKAECECGKIAQLEAPINNVNPYLFIIHMCNYIVETLIFLNCKRLYYIFWVSLGILKTVMKLFANSNPWNVELLHTQIVDWQVVLLGAQHWQHLIFVEEYKILTKLIIFILTWLRRFNLLIQQSLSQKVKLSDAELKSSSSYSRAWNHFKDLPHFK